MLTSKVHLENIFFSEILSLYFESASPVSDITHRTLKRNSLKVKKTFKTHIVLFVRTFPIKYGFNYERTASLLKLYIIGKVVDVNNKVQL